MNNEKLILYYNALNGKTPTSKPIEIYSPICKVITPSVSDYKNGVYTRYFVRRINYNICMETSLDEVEKVDKNYYISTSISWKLTGNINTSISTYGEKLIGVIEYNSNQVTAAELIIPEVKNILSNKLQFYRET